MKKHAVWSLFYEVGKRLCGGAGETAWESLRDKIDSERKDLSVDQWTFMLECDPAFESPEPVGGCGCSCAV